MMQLSRLFETVYLLLNHKRLTASELAQRFEVSTRTIYRDIETLSASGIPVYTTQGMGGGICIGDSYVLNKSTLSDEEQAQILLALESLSATDAAQAGALLGKLGSLFNKESANWIEVDFSRWGNREQDRNALATLKDAILGQQALSFTYYTGYGEVSQRKVYPIKLIYKGRAWYLQAFDLTRDAYRTFKMCRMEKLSQCGEAFVRESLPQAPPLEPSVSGVIPTCQATLHFHQSAAWRIWDEFGHDGVIRDTDGSFIVKVLLPNDSGLLPYLISLGTAVKVLAPPELRQALALELKTILAAYEDT